MLEGAAPASRQLGCGRQQSRSRGHRAARGRRRLRPSPGDRRARRGRRGRCLYIGTADPSFEEALDGDLIGGVRTAPAEPPSSMTLIAQAEVREALEVRFLEGEGSLKRSKVNPSRPRRHGRGGGTRMDRPLHVRGAPSAPSPSRRRTRPSSARWIAREPPHGSAHPNRRDDAVRSPRAPCSSGSRSRSSRAAPCPSWGERGRLGAGGGDLLGERVRKGPPLAVR